jgi:hypothetical protein
LLFSVTPSFVSFDPQQSWSLPSHPFSTIYPFRFVYPSPPFKMKTQQILNLVPLVALATAMPTGRLHAREVPQEHSHEQFLTTVRTFLNMNNPAGIVDPVFGLLGDKV